MAELGRTIGKASRMLESYMVALYRKPQSLLAVTICSSITPNPGRHDHLPPGLPDFIHTSPNLSLYQPSALIALGTIAVNNATRNIQSGERMQEGNGRRDMR